jgi:hypothetical protein
MHKARVAPAMHHHNNRQQTAELTPHTTWTSTTTGANFSECTGINHQRHKQQTIYRIKNMSTAPAKTTSYYVEVRCVVAGILWFSFLAMYIVCVQALPVFGTPALILTTMRVVHAERYQLGASTVRKKRSIEV